MLQILSILLFSNLSLISPLNSSRQEQIESCKDYIQRHPEVLRLTSEIVPPILIKKKEIDTAKLRQINNKIWNMIIAEAVVTSSGDIQDICIIRKGHPKANERLLKALRKWKYFPATKKGKPVSVFMTFTVRFCPMR